MSLFIMRWRGRADRDCTLMLADCVPRGHSDLRRRWRSVEENADSVVGRVDTLGDLISVSGLKGQGGDTCGGSEGVHPTRWNQGKNRIRRWKDVRTLLEKKKEESENAVSQSSGAEGH